MPSRKISPMLITLIVTLMLSACGGHSSNKPTTKEAAITKITAFAENGANPAPTLQDYLDAGVTGVTSENLTALNTVVENLESQDVDTTEELNILTAELDNNIAPVANAGDDKTVEVNKPITIMGSATDSDGNIVTIEWKNGSELLSTNATFDYTPTVVGTDTLTLTVTDNDGESASDQMDVLVVAIPVDPVNPPVDPNEFVDTDSDGIGNNVDTDDDGDGYSDVDEIAAGTDPLDATSKPLLADEAPPVISIIGDDITLIQGSIYTEQGATATDDRDGTVEVVITGVVDINTIGDYTITYTATDVAGNVATATRTVTVNQVADSTPPVITLNGNDVITIDVGTQYIDAGASAIDVNDGVVSVETTGSVNTNTGGTYRITYSAVDAAGNTATAVRLVIVKQTRDVSNFTVDNFGYPYTDLIPADASKSSYDETRFSMLAGTILDVNGNPIAGVKVSIHKHNEYGTTKTDSTGNYTIPTEGGVSLIVRYDKAGFTTIDRTLKVLANDWTKAPDVTMLKLDDKTTVIDFSNTTPQVHSSSMVSDEKGERTTTLVFDGVTKATVTSENGAVRELTSFSVSATEFQTPKSMPSTLPRETAFTYASDLHVSGVSDNESVIFDAPIVMYVDNFLGFEVGEVVPVGYYDRKAGQWKGSENGVVVKLLDINNDGIVDALDSDGDDTPNDLDGNGSFANEVSGIANDANYLAGKTYWRASFTHFTPWDFNWPWGPPSGALSPLAALFANFNNQCNANVNSYVETKSRVFHEDIAVAGTGLTLHYSSKRVHGYKAIDATVDTRNAPDFTQKATLKLEVAGREFTKDLALNELSQQQFEWDGRDASGNNVQGKITAKVTVSYFYTAVYYSIASDREIAWAEAGIEPTIVPARDLLTISTSSTMDIYNESASIATGDIANGWTLSNHDRIANNIIYKGDGESEKATEVSEVTGIVTTTAGNGSTNYSGDGGSALDAELGDVYDIAVDDIGNQYILSGYKLTPDSKEIRVVRKVDLNGIIKIVAGGGILPEYPEFEIDPATTDPTILQEFKDLSNTYDIENQDIKFFGSDAYLEYLDAYLLLIKNHYPAYYAGYIENQNLVFENNNPDGVDATTIKLNTPTSIAIDNSGNLYIASIYNVKKVDSNGIISTVAGYYPKDLRGLRDHGKTADGFGDKGNARLAKFFTSDVAVDNSGNIFIVDYQNSRVRKINSSGIITTVAGNGNEEYSGESGEAVLAGGINIYSRIEMDNEGNLYIRDFDSSDTFAGKVRKVDTSGLITVIVDSSDENFFEFISDGQDLPSTFFAFSDFTLDKYQNIYFTFRNSVYKRLTNGLIIKIAGKGTSGFAGDGGVAGQALFDNPNHVTINENGVLYVFDEGNARIRKITPTTLIQSIVNSGGFVVKRPNNTADIFDNDGKQRRTIDLNTNNSLVTYNYDSQNRLVSISNQFNEVVTITRDVSGAPTLITAPNGQQTQLTLAPNGDLQQVLYEDGSHFGFTYFDGSLMDVMTDPNSNQTTHFYDSSGRIDREVDASGAVWGFAHALEEGLNTYTLTKPEGEIQTTQDLLLANGDTQSTVTLSVGDIITTITSENDDSSIMSRDGVTAARHYKTDPETLRKVLDTAVTSMPSGLVSNQSYARNYTKSADLNKTIGELVSLTQNNKTLNIQTDYETGVINSTTPEGRTAQRLYDKNTRLLQRLSVGTLTPSDYQYDAKGRLTGITTGARTQQFSYDTRGNLATSTDAKGEVTSYSYDIMDRLIKAVYPTGKTVNYQYDAKGNLTQLVTPTPTEHAFSYNKNDQRIGMTSPEAQATAYRYNKSRQLTGITTASGKQINNDYINGRLQKTTTPEGIFSYQYRFGNKASQVNYGDESLSYQYDGDLLTQITQAGVLNTSIAYSYNNDFLVKQSQYAGKTINYGYDKDSLLTSSGDYTLRRDTANAYITQVSDGSYTQARTYNDLGETTKISDNSFTLSISARDNNGDITQKQETLSGITDTFDYRYNALGRLIEVKQNGTTTEAYNYDNNGNRLTATLNGQISTGSYNDDDQLISYGENNYQYDADGYLSQKTTPTSTTQYSYGTLGELRRVAITENGNPPKNIDYQHDANNQRVAKLINGEITEKYLWADLTTLLAVYDKNDKLLQRFDYAGQRMPISMETPTGKYYLHYNQVGSLRAITNSNHQIEKKVSYDSFGNIQNDSNPSLSIPFGFAGGLYDKDTQLTRFGYRDYDAQAGRWTAKDPIDFAGGDANLYGYVGGNPTGYVDPLGLDASLNPKDPMMADPSDYVLPQSSVPYDINKIIRGEQAPPDWHDYWTGLAMNATAGALFGGKFANNVCSATYKYGSTPKGLPLTKHYATDTGPKRNIPGSVVDNTIDTTKGLPIKGGKTVHYDKKNNITVITGHGRSIMSVRKGKPRKGQLK